MYLAVRPGYEDRPGTSLVHHMKRLCLAFLLATCGFADAAPLSLHPENPHYFLFRDKPAVLITSAEHYGAVLNLDFDYVKYLDTLAADGLNLTRIFSGAYVEPQGAFNIEKNTLAPAPDASSHRGRGARCRAMPTAGTSST